jgi:hypothetical protein
MVSSLQSRICPPPEKEKEEIRTDLPGQIFIGKTDVSNVSTAMA